MKFAVLTLTTINIWVVLVACQPCYFDFEDDSEFENFKFDCNGLDQRDEWIIKERSNIPVNPPPGTGDRVLTSKAKELSPCMQTMKKIALQEKQEMVIILFRKRSQDPDNYSLDVSVLCTSENNIFILKWSVLDGTEELNGDGEWEIKSNVFTIGPNATCTIQIDIYRNGNSVVDLDKITLLNTEPSDDCYVVPKPTTTTTEESTSDPTTTEQSTSDSTTTEESTSDPTTNEQSTSDSTTTEESTSDPTTTEQSTSDPTTTEQSTNDPITTEDSTSDPTTEPTTLSNESTDGSETDKTDGSTVTHTISTEITSTIEPSPPRVGKYSDFSTFYMVIIIATFGGTALLSTGVCLYILRLSRPKKKSHRKQWYFVDTVERY